MWMYLYIALSGLASLLWRRFSHIGFSMKIKIFFAISLLLHLFPINADA